jgi:uncharacterized protein (DUF342 family)
MDFTPNIDSAFAEYIEPTICFSTNKIKIGDKYPLEKLPVIELVKRDQVMLEYSDTDLPETGQLLRRTITVGQNAYLSEDGREILAGIIGYPHIEFRSMEESGEKVLHVSVEPLFQLSKNKMGAAIIIKPLLFHYNLISSEDLYKLLIDEGIVHGVVYRQLNLVRECIRTRNSEAERITLAKGREPTPGINAHLKFHLEIGPIAGELLPDGSIDFRERKIMVPVSNGQVIATKVPATKGRPGMTVLGERVAQRQGRDVEIETIDHAAYSSEKQQVSATSDGVLSVVNNNVIKVCSKLEIPGDIDYSTGNIESRNSIVIHGSVLPGFQVKTGGDLEVKGSIMSTQVTGLANIVIKGGITGNVSTVTSSGDVDIHFIEQGQIRCNGNCVIRKQCYYSKVYSGGNIRCREHSTVVGGELVAEGNITLGDVGASGADPVFIGAGVSAERLFYSRKFFQRLKEDKESIMQRLKRFTGTARTKKLRSLKGGLEEMKRRYLRINMIPGTGLYSSSAEDAASVQTGQGADKIEQNKADSPDIETIGIDVHGTVFSGTILQIGNRSLTVKQTVIGQRFQLDDSGNYIVGMPLRTRK